MKPRIKKPVGNEHQKDHKRYDEIGECHCVEEQSDEINPYQTKNSSIHLTNRHSQKNSSADKGDDYKYNE